MVLTKEVSAKEKDVLTQEKVSLKLKIPQIKFRLDKKVILILVLILFLALGFFIFEKREEKELKLYQKQLNQVEEKVNRAENYLIIAKGNPQTEKKANVLLKEAWGEMSPLVSIASSFSPELSHQILSLKKTISENLYQLNKLKVIEEIQPIFEFNSREFIPQRIISQSENLYFFNPYFDNLFKLNKENQGQLIETTQKLDLATLIDNSILFLSKPNQLISFKENQFGETVSLQAPYPDFDFNAFSSYQSNLYFLDQKQGQIIKYPDKGNPAQLWNKKTIEAKSMAVDGNIWLLAKDNSIEKYYAGNFQKTLELEIFPFPESFSKIFTSAQFIYLYVLEPSQKRIIILNKSGQILKQFQSEKFDNLLDFTISEDAKTIYLLNGLKVYKILF